MYPNLRAEMARRNITGYELAEKIGITNGTFSLKFNGKSEFTLDEALKIKNVLESDLSIEVLFSTE